MRILVVGASGTIGAAVVAALSEAHDVVAASRSRSALALDLADPASVRALYDKLGRLDAVVCTAGRVVFAPLAKLSDEEMRLSLDNKLMGQVNLVRYGLDHVADGGSFTLTSGVLARAPMPGSAAISLVNAGVEAFARAAALEAPRGIRINVVSPPWVRETLIARGMDPTPGLPAADVARAYVRSVTGSETGAVIDPAAA